MRDAVLAIATPHRLPALGRISDSRRRSSCGRTASWVGSP